MIRNPYIDYKKVALAVFLTWGAWIMVTHQCLITSPWMILLSWFYNWYLVAIEMYENIHPSVTSVTWEMTLDADFGVYVMRCYLTSNMIYNFDAEHCTETSPLSHSYLVKIFSLELACALLHMYSCKICPCQLYHWKQHW